VREAYFKTLEVTGNGVFFTGIILASGWPRDVFAAQVPGGHGPAAGVPVPDEHDRGAGAAPALAYFIMHREKRHQS